MIVLPSLIERSCGGWLAVSPPGETIKIGVTAPSKDGANERYAFSLGRWRESLDTINAAAANTRTTDPTSQRRSQRQKPNQTKHT